MRLQEAALAELDSDGEHRDGEDGAPDLFVELVANRDGDTWRTDVVEDTWEAGFGEAAWEGEPVSEDDLLGFGFQVRVDDDDAWGEDDAVGPALVEPTEDELAAGTSVVLGCAAASFSFVEIDGG